MSIYREEILDHYKHPRNFGMLPSANATATEDNMPCGDRMTIMLHIDKDVVNDMKFECTGCALSIACASMLTELVKNKTLASVETLKESDILNFTGGAISPGRLNCALLGWHTMKKALTQIPASHTQSLTKEKAIVSRDMNLGEIAARWPAARAVLLDYGLHCVGCFASSFDTLEAGGKVHGMSDAEIDEMVREVNEMINRSESMKS